MLCVAKPPRRSGKDMTNITGLSELLDDKPSSGKRKKRSRHLTTLESDDETEDESDEFQLSEYALCSSMLFKTNICNESS